MPQAHPIHQLKRFNKRLRALLAMPFFWIVTALVNGMAITGAVLFHHFESDMNASIGSFLDSFGWSVGLITTIGFGNVIPVTLAGKILSIVMMICGTIFLWLYMAFFVSALISPELYRLETEILDVEEELKHIRTHRDILP